MTQPLLEPAVQPLAPPSVPDAGLEPARPVTPASGRHSLAALVMGIVAAVSAAIPGASFATWVPAGVAIILGTVMLVSGTPSRGRGITAIVLGAVAWLVAIIVSVVFIVALSGGPASPKTSVGESQATQPTEAAAPAEPSVTPTPAAPVIPADNSYSGTGDSVLPIVLPDGTGSKDAATITATGSSNFVVWSLDSNASQRDLLVNTIGSYTGTVLIGEGASANTASLQILATGPWTVTVHSLKALREFTDSGVTGTGDDVVVYRGKAGAATLTHSGSSNFIVWTYGSRSDLAVNTIGAYTGTVLWQGGPSVVSVKADGAWSITVQ